MRSNHTKTVKTFSSADFSPFWSICCKCTCFWKENCEKIVTSSCHLQVIFPRLLHLLVRKGGKVPKENKERPYFHPFRQHEIHFLIGNVSFALIAKSTQIFISFVFAVFFSFHFFIVSYCFFLLSLCSLHLIRTYFLAIHIISVRLCKNIGDILVESRYRALMI